jgi:hypothetical protein
MKRNQESSVKISAICVHQWQGFDLLGFSISAIFGNSAILAISF